MTQREFVEASAAEYGKRIQRGLPQSRAVAEILTNMPQRAFPGSARVGKCLFPFRFRGRGGGGDRLSASTPPARRRRRAPAR